MSIPESRYVDITSSVVAGASVSRREFMIRAFTTSDRLGPGTYKEFSSSDSVSSYFGSDSEEYSRAVYNFGYTAAQPVARPQHICFARWVDTAVAPIVYGATGTQSVSTYTGISDGAFSITMGGTTVALSSLDFTSATSLADVADVVETAIQGGDTDAMWTAATVAWDSTFAQFVLTGGTTGEADAITIASPSSGTDVADLLGWLSASAVFTVGSDVETALAALEAADDLSNNYGSFLFQSFSSLSDDDITDIADWNDEQNFLYMFLIPVSSSTASAMSTLLIDTGGCAMTLTPSDEYQEMIPGMILAATIYDVSGTTKKSTVQNYMYAQPSGTATVTTSDDADTYDGFRVNYIGQTQQAGDEITFYQRGLMCGTASDAQYMNVYANEMWLKDAVLTLIMTVLLDTNRVSYNTKGKAKISSCVQSIISEAQQNGTISEGSTLTTTQRLYVAEETGSDIAYAQIEKSGYWLGLGFSTSTSDSVTTYIITYTLLYKKDDVVNKIEGTHELV